MRNISFMLTTEAFRAGTKTVTRRCGWWDLRPGTRLMGVEKSQGLKKGEKIVRLHPIVVLRAESQPLWIIKGYGIKELRREGLPDMTADGFIEMFIKHNWSKCRRDRERTLVNRIVFRHLHLNLKWFPGGKL